MESTENTGFVQVVIQTIGTLHPGAIDLIGDGLFYDLSDKLRNPHEDPAMRHKTGLDREVYQHVINTPGADPLINRIVTETQALIAQRSENLQLTHVTIACRGGRHRSVAIAEIAAQYLRAEGAGVEIEHRHIEQPVVQ
ncbi:hypothetical protein OG432_24315 [Streptomyces sp. NBC_00442]|uniref:RapZ C-terminal domain-containing protein n=1 Tax=Streptomyces sp. NBC_00442 TaxID=2903651 RepID=UPI002E1C9318